ncbi:hypothetical protein J14TS2_43210 [Bacillus sp. J14TS2]|uniref:sporulation YhaL family protein n=1 Tax=unclassified Bacillus (in: firmicutes) TaxID=185979 RepID=UPI001A95C56E|nr:MULTISPECIES: sporulation YhaL family protein [unclassified Bacillus (in: firmicutes)]MBO0993612.1 sporulation YhaL family protein [Bacillus sp. SD088]GIN73846.1 hypothetical protein J14TS2_43210 [Bacillus sp. J14TS2]
MSLPIWIYVVVAGIFLSAFMAVKTAKEDRDMEEEWIEQEGQVYVDRMQKEKKDRQKLKTLAGK